jgi:hypothetical protein
MENLYSQNPTMALRADYKAALLQLCCKILNWFVNAFKLADAIRNDAADFLTETELTGTIAEEIKEMD